MKKGAGDRGSMSHFFFISVVQSHQVVHDFWGTLVGFLSKSDLSLQSVYIIGLVFACAVEVLDAFDLDKSVKLDDTCLQRSNQHLPNFQNSFFNTFLGPPPVLRQVFRLFQCNNCI